jgi:outer membrane PBP1 activator LpoA protein
MRKIKLPQKTVRLCLAALLAFAAWVTLPGCASVEKNQDPAALAAAHLDDFNSAAPAAKQAWDLASAQINGNDFESALATLEQLRGQTELSPEQIKAVDATMAAVRVRKQAKTAGGH